MKCRISFFDIEEDHINDNFKQISKVYIAKS